MADLASSAVEFLDKWLIGGGLAPRKFTAKKVRLTLSGQGTTTNKIPASVLKLRSIQECSPAVKSDDSLVIVAAPSYDKSCVLLKAAGSNAPADVTATVEMIVSGPSL